MSDVTILVGDCRQRLAEMEPESVHCIVSSPPYFGHRDYGVDGQIGLEASPDAFIVEMVAVFREARRVLRKDGTLWLNLGDSYNAGRDGGHAGGKNGASRPHIAPPRSGANVPGLKPKDLIGVPWRAAFALQADGWWLRSDIIWHKPNPMPESVTDRPTSAHEHMFLLTKAERYFFDADAVREANAERYQKPAEWTRHGQAKTAKERKDATSINADGANAARFNGLGRNLRNVWTIATEPYPGAHFATFPPSLIEPCIKAGCPVGGTVLDPFGGAGTTGLVAKRLGRNAVLIELNPEYADMARARIRADLGTVRCDLPETANAGPLFGAMA